MLGSIVSASGRVGGLAPVDPRGAGRVDPFEDDRTANLLESAALDFFGFAVGQHGEIKAKVPGPAIGVKATVTNEAASSKSLIPRRNRTLGAFAACYVLDVMPKNPMLDPAFLRDMEAANRFATELNQSSYFREMTEAAQVAHDLRTKHLLGMTDDFGKSMALLGKGFKPLLDQLDAIRATNPFIGGSALQTHIDQLHANFALPALISDRFSPIRDHFAAESKQIREFLSTFELSDGVRKLMAGYQSSLLRPTAWEAMTSGFDRLNDAYDDLLEDPVAMQLPVVADLRLPERDVRSHAAVVNAFGDDEDEGAVLPAYLLDAPDQTLRRLRAVSPRLADKFESAIRTLGSIDPQAASNACLAVRQILLGLLDTFAPRDVVKEWAKAHCPDALHKGNPTPAGRVMYLSRFELSENTSYSEFLLENCRSLRWLMDLINDVIHDESATGPRVAMPPHRVQRVLFRASSAFDEILICAEVQKLTRKRAN